MTKVLGRHHAQRGDVIGGEGEHQSSHLNRKASGMRTLRSRLWILGATASLVLTGSLALTTATPAGASAPAIMVHCPGDLQGAINNAAPGSTLVVDGTCTGNFFVWKDLTLSGPATLDGASAGATVHVLAVTAALNNLTIQHGAGFGGGVWNDGHLTLNNATVTANDSGGIFNQGQLTVNGSTVSHNTSDWNSGGIYNCGDNPAMQFYGFCLSPASLTLNGSTVSNNVERFGSGGGITNDPSATMTINTSVITDNTAGASGGGIDNNGTATITLSAINNNTSNGGSNTWSGGGGIHNTGPTTIRASLIRNNTAAWLAGGIFAGGPTTITNAIVIGNHAGPAGGGMVTWDGPTTVANSVFSNNGDQGSFGPDNPAGVYVATNPLWLQYFPNIHPSFTTTHSTFS